MHCSKCGTAHENEDRFCRKCGASVANAPTQTIITSSDQSFNAGQHNVITGNNISLGGSTGEVVAEIDRLKVTPLKLFGHPVKVAWLIVSGLLGVVGSAVTIWSVWTAPHSYFWILLCGISGVALLVGVALSRMRFARLPHFLNLEASKSGEIFISTIGGHCPKCDGQLKLRDVGSREHKVTVVRCTRNPDHMWGFDPTVLEDL